MTLEQAAHPVSSKFFMESSLTIKRFLLLTIPGLASQPKKCETTQIQPLKLILYISLSIHLEDLKCTQKQKAFAEARAARQSYADACEEVSAGDLGVCGRCFW